MKRLQMLLVPLFAVPFLTGCKIGGLEDTHLLLFSDKSENCHMEIDGEECPSIITNKKVVAIIAPDDDTKYTFPKTLNLTIGNTEEKYEGDFTYDVETGKLTIKMTDDVTITATAELKN